MNNKSVCVFRQFVCLVLGFALLSAVTAGSAYAAPGFSSLRDVQAEIAEKKEETAKSKIQNVLLGGMIVFSPQELAQAVKQFALDQVRNTILNTANKLLNKVGLNAIALSKNEQQTVKETGEKVGDIVAAVGQATATNAARVQDAANLAERRTAQAVLRAENPPVDAENAGMRACLQVAEAQRSQVGGPDSDLQRGTPTQRDVFNTLRKGAKDSNGKTVFPSTGETVAVLADKSTGDIARGGAASIGGNNWQGPATQRRDQSKHWVNMYACKGDHGGAAGQAGLDCTGHDKQHALDLRSADLLPKQGQTLSMLCFKKAAKGEYILDGFDAAFCGSDESKFWDAMVNTKRADGKVWRNTIDYSTAIVIRDYMMPAALTGFNPQFLNKMKENHAGTQEIFAKRQAFENVKGLVAGIYSQRIAEMAPQRLGDNPSDNVKVTDNTSADKTNAGTAGERFAKFWEKVYPTTPVPPNPSQKARRDVEIEYLRTPYYIEDRINTLDNNPTNALREQLRIQGLMAGTQKDIQYSLERIEMLLATMLSNDLQDRRAGLERDIKAANNSMAQQ